MRQVLAVSKTGRFPSFRQWLQAGRVLSRNEKNVVAAAGAVVLLSALTLAGQFLFAHRVEEPGTGGMYVEAVVGEPQFINPLYAPANDPDADLARLVYSGLMRRLPDGSLANDLATDIKASDDGKTYTVTLRTDARFTNGGPVQAKDVLFTFGALRDPLYRSPLSAAYQDVDVSQTDDKTVVFTLKDPNAYFPSLLTVGILPADLWGDVAPHNAPLAAYNLKPVGSGPYLFKQFEKDQKGNIHSYTLVRNPDYYGQAPRIDQLTFKFYADAESAVKAVETHNVEGVAYVPPELEAEIGKTKAVNLLRPEIPRETVLFFNQDHQALLKNKAIRQAIALAIDRQAVIDAAVNGHGTAIAGPVLAEALNGLPAPTMPVPDVAAANKLLDDAGLTRPAGSEVRVQTTPSKKKGTASTVLELSFTLTTVQAPEFLQAAQTVATELAAIGIKVQIAGVNPQDLVKTTLEPRNFDLLLTGLLYGDNPDPYPFWHSSQATMKGLNLADYAVKKTDDLLAKARTELDPAARAKDYADFQAQVLDDVPAVFLYRPTYTYAVGNKVKGVTLDWIHTPSDRLSGIADWYVKTKQTLK